MPMILLFNGSISQEPLVPLGKPTKADGKCSLLKEVSFRLKQGHYAAGQVANIVNNGKQNTSTPLSC